MRKIILATLLITTACAQLPQESAEAQRCRTSGVLPIAPSWNDCLKKAHVDIADEQEKDAQIRLEIEKQNTIIAMRQIKEQAIAEKKAKTEQRRVDQETCKSYGFRKGTNGFASCMMKVVSSREQDAQIADMRRQDAERQQAILNAQAQQMAAERQAIASQNMMNLGAALLVNSQPQPMAFPQQTHCTTRYIGNQARTDCY